MPLFGRCARSRDPRDHFYLHNFSDKSFYTLVLYPKKLSQTLWALVLFRCYPSNKVSKIWTVLVRIIYCRNSQLYAIIMKRTRKPNIPVEPTEVVEQYHPGTSPKLYNKKMANRILMLAKLGAIQREIATAIGISVKTLEMWLRDRQDIREAYDKGKFIHDHGVEESLLKRAMGYEYEEVKTVKGTDSIGRPYEYTTTRMVKVLPDPTSMIFWLKNRNPGKWADTQHHKISSSVDVNINNTLKLDTLSDQEREIVQSIALKQLSGTGGLKK